MPVDTYSMALERERKALAERDAALAEVARLSTPPDDAEVAGLVMKARDGLCTKPKGGPFGPGWSVDLSATVELLNAMADAITRLSHALRREREPVEPVAWRWKICYREEWCWSATKPMFSPRDLEQGTVFDVQPLYTTPPDALALVAADYLDAANKAKSVGAMLCAADIRAKTPADAQAALTAIERAAYDRGVRDAALKAYQWGDADDGQEMHDRILALLTQEGR